MFVTVGLCQDACGGDRGVQSVAPYDRAVRYARVRWKAVSIHEDEGRSLRQPVERQVHGTERGLQYVDAIDLGGVYLCYRKGKGFPFNKWTKDVPVFFPELLGIVQQRMVKIRGQDYCRREYRTRKATPSCFVAAGFRAFTEKKGF